MGQLCLFLGRTTTVNQRDYDLFSNVNHLWIDNTEMGLQELGKLAAIIELVFQDVQVETKVSEILPNYSSASGNYSNRVLVQTVN